MEISGYNYQKQKSNRAIAAEQKGLVNLTMLSKKLAIDGRFLGKHAPYEEWHHTSRWYNETKYYDITKVKEWFDQEGAILLKSWREEQRNLRAKNKQKPRNTYNNCKIEWLEWPSSGRIRIPKTFKSEEAILIEKGEQFFEIRLPANSWLISCDSGKKEQLPKERVFRKSRYAKGFNYEINGKHYSCN